MFSAALPYTNFTTWYRNSRIVLKHDKKEHVLENPLPEGPTENANATTLNVYQKVVDESNEISCLMLACMEPDLQQQFENVEAYDMIENLKSMFQMQARTERFNVWRSLMDCKLKEGDPLSPHVIKMIGYMQALDRLGFPLMGMSCPPIQFWVLFRLAMGRSSRTTIMHGMEKKLTELHGMLKVAEQDIKKGTHQVLMVQNSAKFKKSWSKKKAKAKGKEKEVVPTSAAAPKSGPDSGTVCYHCKETGHWKRNCSKWLAEHGKKAGSVTSGKGTLVTYSLRYRILYRLPCKSTI